ncbi:MAG: DUF4340 domain-containing protein, partial [Verrucomicrobia bacterium]|nr:DUF4340 domain-containing protein [Verrucomicrobiota bacterium]
QIAIKQHGNELNLAKKDDLWRVRERGDYLADFGDISKLLLKLRDLKAVQTEKIGASQLGRLELAPPGTNSDTATLIELRDNGGKVIRSLLLGKKHMQKSSRPSQFGEMDGEGGFADGRHVMMDTASGNVVLISDALTEAEAKPEQWLNKSFIKIEKQRSISVTHAEATNSWSLTRESETNEWKLAEAKPAEKLDSGKSSGVTSPFSSASLADVAIGLTPEQTGLSKPTVVKVGTSDGLEYIINVGAKTNDNYFVAVSLDGKLVKERTPGKDEKAEDKARLDKEFADSLKKLEEKLETEKAFGKWTYLISSWTVDSLLKKRAELLEDKKDETKPEDAAAEKQAVSPAPLSNP